MKFHSKFVFFFTLWVLPLATVVHSNTDTTDDPLHAMSNETEIKKQIDSLSKARYLLFPHIYRDFIDAGRNPGSYNVSIECEEDLVRYYNGLNAYKAWAWMCK